MRSLYITAPSIVLITIVLRNTVLAGFLGLLCVLSILAAVGLSSTVWAERSRGSVAEHLAGESSGLKYEIWSQTEACDIFGVPILGLPIGQIEIGDSEQKTS